MSKTLTCRYCSNEWPRDVRPPTPCGAYANFSGPLGGTSCRSVIRYCRSCFGRLVRQMCEDLEEFYQRERCGDCRRTD